MDCALWLNRRKIFTAAEIQGNLDVASLRGYLLAGTLIEWLNEHGGKRYARKLSALSPDDERLGEKIAEIFGAKPLRFKELNGGVQSAEGGAPASPDSGSGHYALPSSYKAVSSYNFGALSSFGSFQSPFAESSGYFFTGSGSYLFGSYSLGSFENWEQFLSMLFGYGSFSAGSFAFGSFHEWEWEWLFRLLYGYGSFTANSFTLGSFNYREWLYNLLFGYGSFSSGSFAFGSFSLESLLKLLFGGFGHFGSFGGYGSFGSADPALLPQIGMPLDEYDLIMLKTLAECPLDRFGYGIHNI